MRLYILGMDEMKFVQSDLIVCLNVVCAESTCLNVISEGLPCFRELQREREALRRCSVA